MALRRSLLCARTRSFALRMQTLVNSDTYDTDLKLVLHTTGLEHTGLLNNKPKKKEKNMGNYRVKEGERSSVSVTWFEKYRTK